MPWPPIPKPPVTLRFEVAQEARDLLSVLNEYIDWKQQRIRDMLEWPQGLETVEAESVARAECNVAMKLSTRLNVQIAYHEHRVKTAANSQELAPGDE